MKKFIALLLVLLTVGSLLAACTAGVKTSDEPETASQPTQPSEPSGDTSGGKPAVDPNKVTTKFDENALYEIKSASGKRLEWDYMSVKDAKEWEGGVWSFDYVERPNGESFSVVYAGDKLKNGLASKRMLENGEMELVNIVPGSASNKAQWYVRDNGDGTYKFVLSGSPKFALGYKDGAFSMQFAEDESTSFTITEVKNENIGTKYSQYISGKGNLTVRLPADVVDQVYARVKSGYKDESEDSLKKRIDERMQMFADSCQKTYEGLIELTGFTPYERIIVYAYEHQGVMAGVVGGDPHIYVNVDWYVDDMEKMWRRWEDGKEDYNFCVLHEMGHMFDWNRGWNFESEMQTDLKATYVLYKHQNDQYGAWAAPAEYDWRSIWNIETIDTKGFAGLSGNMSYREVDGKVTYHYNIYRCAQMYTSYVKYCEATEGLRGYEGMIDVFHWFQDEGLTTSSHTGAERIELFNQKFTEFCGYDIDKFMKETYKRNRADWQAPFAKAAGLPEN